MSSVAEIERAIEALPTEQWLELAAWLEERQRRIPSWPVAPPKVPKEELDRVEATIEAAFPQQQG